MKNGLFVKREGYYHYKNDLLHREDGPAVEWFNGNKWWFINGQYHRADGPAYEHTSGYKIWYLNDKRIYCNTNEEFLRLVKLKAFL